MESKAYCLGFGWFFFTFSFCIFGESDPHCSHSWWHPGIRRTTWHPPQNAAVGWRRLKQQGSVREVRLPKAGKWGCHRKWDPATSMTPVYQTCTNLGKVNVMRIKTPFLLCPWRWVLGYLLQLGGGGMLSLFTCHLSAGTSSPLCVSHKEEQCFLQRVHFHF